MKAKFVYIGGIGHAGTKWLVTVLNCPGQGVRFNHQLKFTFSNKSWNSFLQLEDKPLAIEGYVDRYCRVLSGATQMRVIGDAISWMPLSIPMVHKRFPITRIIYLVRHGIPQLNSISRKSPFNPIYDNQWLYGIYLKRYWEIMGQPIKPWAQWTRWERLCLWWSTNAFMPDWLRKQLHTQVDVVRLEDLTQSVVALGQITKSLGLKIGVGKLRKIQRTDINRKVHTDRRPISVWNSWTGAQRRAFQSVCGPAMKKLGYKVIYK